MPMEMEMIEGTRNGCVSVLTLNTKFNATGAFENNRQVTT